MSKLNKTKADVRGWVTVKAFSFFLSFFPFSSAVHKADLMFSRLLNLVFGMLLNLVFSDNTVDTLYLQARLVRT